MCARRPLRNAAHGPDTFVVVANIRDQLPGPPAGTESLHEAPLHLAPRDTGNAVASLVRPTPDLVFVVDRDPRGWLEAVKQQSCEILSFGFWKLQRIREELWRQRSWHIVP
jgi:hypothetical protein